MQNITALITGATSGIGKACAIKLADLRINLILACRNLHKAELVKKTLQCSSNVKIDLVPIDLANLKTVREAAFSIINNYSVPDIIINNAGVFNSSRKETVDGLEHTMAVNYFSHFLLTHLLLPSLKNANKPVRIINVSSKAGLHSNLPLDKLNFQKRYHSFKAYGASKLAQLYFTRELAERLLNTKITINAVHPGNVNTNIWSIKTNFITNIIKKFSKTPAEAAETIVYLATANKLTKMSGKFFNNNNKLITYNKNSSDALKQQQLWNYSMNVVEKFLNEK